MEDLELVVLFADADAQRFVTKLIERGIERRCLRPMKWRQIRDPMHDPRVARDPTAALALFLRHPTCRFVVVLGLGRQARRDGWSIRSTIRADAGGPSATGPATQR